MYFVVVTLLAIIYFAYENTALYTNYYRAKNKKIKKDTKIAHLSDIHSMNNKITLNSIIKKLKTEKPDIIVITGDLYDDRVYNRKSVNYLIKNIKDICPIYYILGNHESRCKFLEEALIEVKREGIIILNDENISLDSNINLMGITDLEFITKNRKEDPALMDKALKKMKTYKSKYNILLSHRPELFDVYTKYNIDLTLSGHAHGGQFIFPYLGAIYAPDQGLFPRFTRGLYKKDDKVMLVSRGIGNSGFPLRINNRPELLIINLNGEK